MKVPGDPERGELADLFDALLSRSSAEVAPIRLRRLAPRLPAANICSRHQAPIRGACPPPGSRIDALPHGCKFKVLGHNQRVDASAADLKTLALSSA